MTPFSLTGLAYVFEGLYVLAISLRFYQYYKKTGYLLAKLFFYPCFFAAVAFFLWGGPSLFTHDPTFLKIGYILSIGFLFSGAFWGGKIPAELGIKIFPKNFRFLLLIIGAILVFLNIIYPPSPFVDSLGILKWGLNLKVSFVFVFSLILLTLTYCLGFFKSAIRIKELGTKRGLIISVSGLFALIGGPLTQITINSDLIILGHIFLLFSGIFAAISIIFYPPLYQEKWMKRNV